MPHQTNMLKFKRIRLALLCLVGTTSCGQDNLTSNRSNLGEPISAADSTSESSDPFQIREGTSVRSDKYPVGLLIKYLTGEKLCSGSMIAPNLFLTARHCIDSSTQLISYAASFQGRIRRARAIAYPSDPGVDIALIALRGSSYYSNSFPKLWASALPIGSTSEAVGFGVFTRNRREKTLASDKVAVADLVLNSVEGRLGTFNSGQEKQACPGDSGGPLYYMHAGNRYLVGVTHAIYGPRGNYRNDLERCLAAIATVAELVHLSRDQIISIMESLERGSSTYQSLPENPFPPPTQPQPATPTPTSNGSVPCLFGQGPLHPGQVYCPVPSQPPVPWPCLNGQGPLAPGQVYCQPSVLQTASP